MVQEMMEKEDKLALVRRAGEAIRADLAANMQARVGEKIEKEVADETRDVLAGVLRNYLEQIMPNVEVKGLTKIKAAEGKIEFCLTASGSLTVSIAPGAKDDALPDPVSSD